MRWSLLIFLASCDVVHDAGQECRKVIDQEAPKLEAAIWEQCKTYYETVAAPALNANIEALLDARMQAAGCVKSDGGDWSCRCQ